MKKIINLKSVRLMAFFVLMTLVFSCTKERVTNVEYYTDNEHIKSISMNDAIVHKYFYDDAGKIVEENCMSFFQKYLYDENDRLVKIESAFDRSGLSSLAPQALRTEFMTSQNSTVDRYSLYEYDNAGRLSKIENYFNETGNGFEFRSMQTFEYNGLNIIRINWQNNIQAETITSFEIYTYDNIGNVINEKSYSTYECTEPELTSEISYKYDNYLNPFRIFSRLSSPGLYTNVNNIIETSVTRHMDVPGFDKYSTSKTTYQYNEIGYPVKAIYGDSVEEYQY